MVSVTGPQILRHFSGGYYVMVPNGTISPPFLTKNGEGSYYHDCGCSTCLHNNHLAFWPTAEDAELALASWLLLSPAQWERQPAP